ncbi:AAA family ATPase [Methylolobus aquaticus]
MIKRINILKRTGRFTNLTCRVGADGDFTELNVIYAHNASGKSTLCDVLRSMTTGEASYILGRKRLDATDSPEVVVVVAGANRPETVRFQGGAWQNAEASPKIHVYDERFVAENVYVGHHINVDQRRNLYGLVIGARAIALQQALDTADQNAKAANIKFNQANAALTRLIPQGQSIESFRGIAEADNAEQAIATAADALNTATQTKNKADAIRQRPALEPVAVAEFTTNLAEVLATTLDDAALAAEQKIKDHLTATSHGLTIEWIGKGHRAQTTSACPHCGQDMTGLDLLHAYQAFFSGELKKHERLRTNARNATDHAFGPTARTHLRQSLAAHQTERTWWADAAAYEFSLPTIRNEAFVLQILEGAHSAITTALDRKQASPGQATALTPEEQQALDEWGSLTTELNTYNEGLAAINETLTQKKTDAATIDVAPLQTTLNDLELSKKRHEQEVIEAYTAFDIATRDKLTAQDAKQTANNALREQTNRLFEVYGTRINELLNLFGVDFRIVCGANNGNYVTFGGGQPSGQLAIEILGTKVASTPADAADPGRPSLANTLSGGDRSALALAFFLATVEQDPDLADSVVVFDDPYHNQDRSRRRCTLERISAIAQTARQCFVLSHDLEFARAVDNRPRTFVLKPFGDRVELEPGQLPLPPDQAYQRNYHRLAAFLGTPEAHLDQLRVIADTLRVILEDYLRLKFPAAWAENDWLGDMIGKIRDAEAGTPLHSCWRLCDELAAINGYSKDFHHAGADDPDPRELRTYVERTLNVIHR